MSSFNKLNQEYDYLGIEYSMRDIEKIIQTTNQLVDEINRGPSTRIGELCNELVVLSSGLNALLDMVRILARPLYQQPIMQSTTSHSESQSSSVIVIEDDDDDVDEDVDEQEYEVNEEDHYADDEDDGSEKEVEEDDDDDDDETEEDDDDDDDETEEDDDDDDDETEEEVFLPKVRQTARKTTCYIVNKLPIAKRARLEL